MMQSSLAAWKTGGIAQAAVAFKCAPAGISPSFGYRHRAMASRLAKATMPTRRMRPPEAAKRRLNQCVSSLSGCKRNQLHACSTSRARTRRLPRGIQRESHKVLGVGARALYDMDPERMDVRI